ncbi:MAG: LysR substrate-binding domain-containing protein [Steroidobacteraceae bacterium]
MHRAAPSASKVSESSNIDVNSMLLFYEVVNAGSINQASIALKAPKATISRRLRRLEQHVGAVLLKRGTQRLSMTSSGEALYQHCERILAEAQTARTAVTEMQTQLCGQLKIATAFGLGRWINPALAKFALEYPKVELVVDETHRWIDVNEEPYDMVIHLGKIRNERLPVRRLAELPRGLYASPRYLTGRAPPRTPNDLLSHSCVVLTQQLDDGLWRFRESASTREVVVQPHARVSNIVIAHELAVAGVGVAILPHAICRQDVADGKLAPILGTWHIPPLVPAATYLERRYLPLRIRALLDLVAAQFKPDLD